MSPGEPQAHRGFFKSPVLHACDTTIKKALSQQQRTTSRGGQCPSTEQKRKLSSSLFATPCSWLTSQYAALHTKKGLEKEAADVLVPFGDVLIAFQVKSKKAPGTTALVGETYLRRVEKTVSEGVDQLKTIKRAVNARQIETLKNAVGVTLPFDPSTVRKIVGIVVIDLPDQRNASRETQIGVFNGYQERHGIPVHIFRSDELQVLTEEVNTLPDFLDYLELREALFSQNKLGPATTELNLLALYKMRPEQLRKASQTADMFLSLEDGLWAGYREKYKENIRQRDIDNEPSYLIDWAIEWVHTSIGFRLEEEVAPTLNNHATLAPVLGYARVALELARLSRVHRRVIGRRWLERMVEAETAGQSSSIIMITPSEALLLMSSSEVNRERRAEQFHFLAAMAYCHLKVDKLIGINTESISAELRSYDFALLEGASFVNEAELRQVAKKLFGPEMHTTETEFRLP